jgi:hypothetical protein
MGRLFVLLTVVTAAGGLGAVGMVACGGENKPPLTPDLVEPPPDQLEAGAPSTTPPPK